MSQSASTNRRYVLVNRPSGLPSANDFKLESGPLPTAGAGQALVRTLWLSLDPYMRGRMSDAPSYTKGVELGAVMVGETVARVEQSNDASLQEGDLVLAPSGWQDYAALDAKLLRKLPKDMEHPSYALGVMGMPGFSAFVGLIDIGQPKRGETVVVGAATGAVGSVVGQIAKLQGCRAVGVAGWPEKCEYAVKELGFDACVNHHDDDMAKQLSEACADGIDVYFESVGGVTTEAVIPLLNLNARMPVCGVVSYYNQVPGAVGDARDKLPLLLRQVLVNRVTIKGFIIFDHYETRYAAFVSTMTQWVREGQVKYREDVIEGLAQAPLGLSGLLRGDNFGKVVVRVADA